MHKIAVSPVCQGWSVCVEGLANQMFFLRGADAERAARGLALSLARTGQHSEIAIWLRDGKLAGHLEI